ncbi:response regulator transcription factor [Roseburia sp. 499]|uniref:response regulator transcription factor n=1 Tax=Roseburia sp. 499 TaxID=1261634 RepID=UPI000951D4B0|nr:response regulator transcription factor [Roseburia sp. 499]WVK70288.1 response regulator transcription factor [Roseburia sp. 499]
MNEKSRILVVDDNSEIREVINILLSGEGYEVEEAGDGAEALQKVQQEEYDLIILDVMMPGLNGYQTCMEIRKNSNAPVLFLSARSQVEDKTMGFSSGGDDYLPKPFSYNELVGRVKALMRRYQVYKGKEETVGTEMDRTIEISGVRIEKGQERVFYEGEEIELTDIEFSILCLLAENRGQIFSVQRIYESVWQENYYYGASNTVMVHIRNLRNKIEKDPHNPEVIKNIWGKGYRCE